MGLKGSESDTPQIKDSLRPEVSGAVALDQPAESSHLKRKRSAEGNGLSRLEKQIKVNHTSFFPWIQHVD